ncbi:MAG: macro domain-containing protein [bacterium]|jgi:O-acetyl-ADP-ribose deacetylase (regulator of RNase III)|nr:macro domain-containing protein [Planctomycetota bacterium]HIL51870.1 macro domain-containing protein [Planctomycetota bacterium]
MPISVHLGDLTQFAADVIVNAANSDLRGGGGVDGALHRAAGPGLLRECLAIGGCATGDAVLTAAFELPARFVVHCVGPIWNGGAAGEAELLAGTHRRALALVRDAGAHSVAFPAISCGVFGYPPELAAKVSLAAVAASLASAGDDLEVSFVCFSEEIRRVFADQLGG